jgi:hypothetical protein
MRGAEPGNSQYEKYWCKVTVIRESTGQQLYYNAWITSHELTPETVEAGADAGRARWKVENEGSIRKKHLTFFT